MLRRKEALLNPSPLGTTLRRRATGMSLVVHRRQRLPDSDGAEPFPRVPLTHTDTVEDPRQASQRTLAGARWRPRLLMGARAVLSAGLFLSAALFTP